MLLPMLLMQDFINRDRNQSAIASKTGLSQKTINNIANCKNFDNFDTLISTQQKLSDYFMSEFDYMKNHIIKLRGE
jgi:DNA-binding XRE family transcriptional regulator